MYSSPSSGAYRHGIAPPTAPSTRSSTAEMTKETLQRLQQARSGLNALGRSYAERDPSFYRGDEVLVGAESGSYYDEELVRAKEELSSTRHRLRHATEELQVG